MRAVFLLPSIALLAGCAFPEPTSSEVSSLDVRLTLSVDNEGAGTTAAVEVDSPVGAFRFTGGDTLRVSAGGITASLLDAQGLLLPAVSLGDASGPVVVDLTRPHDTSLTGLTIVEPPPFLLTAASTTVGTSQPIALNWGAATGDYVTTLTVSGSCIAPLTRTLAHDTGSYTVQTAELSHVIGGAATCPLTVMLTRSITVSTLILPDEGSGTFNATAEQNRTIMMTWSP